MSMADYPLGAALTLEQLSDDPHPHLARLRAKEPVSWVPALEGWLVTRRDLALAVMRDDETYTVDDERFSTARVIGPSMLSLDGQEHWRHRQPFADPFRSDQVRDSLSGWVHGRSAELVEEMAPSGRGDLLARLAAPLAVEAMERALMLTGVDADHLSGWYEAIVAAVHTVTGGQPVPQSGSDAFGELRAAVATGVADSLLLSDARDQLSLDEITSNVAVLLFGGIVTAQSSTAIALQYLLSDPAATDTVRGDPTLVSNVFEESLRLEPSASVVDRYSTAETVLGEARIEASDLVRVSLAGANRDPDFFDNPHRFDVHRPNANQNLAFARGPHACLGIHLARLEAKAAVNAVLGTLDSPRLDLDSFQPPRGLVFRSPESVIAVWDEQQSRAT